MHLHVDIPAEFYLDCILVSLDLKWIPVLEPVIRHFLLEAVFNLLLEHTVAVTDTTAVGRIIQGCKGIQETGCKTAKTSVTKSCIRLLVLDQVKVESQLIQALPYLIVAGKVDHIVAQGTPHEELHGHVVYHLLILLLIGFVGVDPLVNDIILDGVCHCLVDLLGCCLVQIASEQKAAHTLKLFFKCFFIKCFFLNQLVNPPNLISPYCFSTQSTTFSLLMFHSLE